MDKSLKMSDLFAAYQNNINIMKLLRDKDSNINSPISIQLSYDLQAGSYTNSFINDPAQQAKRKNHVLKIAEIICPYVSDNFSILEAGIGEATNLALIINALNKKNLTVFGLDISLSRLLYARAFMKYEANKDISLFMADMINIPLPDNSIDVILTLHSLEPNHGREKELMKELYRVARKTVILFEPAYEQAGEEARQRMETHGYARGIPDISRKLGWTVVQNKLVLPEGLNPTAVTIIEKKVGYSNNPDLTCPACGNVLIEESGHLFCKSDGVVYPVLKDIPCLLPTSSIIATKFMTEL